MSGDAWKEGGIDATGKPYFSYPCNYALFSYSMKMCFLIDYLLYHAGALMVITLKVISCAVNYNDGLLKDVVGI